MRRRISAEFLADAGDEHQAVDPTQDGGEPADLPGGAVHEVVHGEPGAGLGALE